MNKTHKALLLSFTLVSSGYCYDSFDEFFDAVNKQMGEVRKSARSAWDHANKELDDLSKRLSSKDIDLTIKTSETDDEFIVEATLPNMKRDDVDVTIKNGALIITGKREVEKKGDDFYKKEIGEFRRAIALPSNVIYEKTTAKMNGETLRITIPKKPEPKKDSINIDVKIEK